MKISAAAIAALVVAQLVSAATPTTSGNVVVATIESCVPKFTFTQLLPPPGADACVVNQYGNGHMIVDCAKMDVRIYSNAHCKGKSATKPLNTCIQGTGSSSAYSVKYACTTYAASAVVKIVEYASGRCSSLGKPLGEALTLIDGSCVPGQYYEGQPASYIGTRGGGFIRLTVWPNDVTCGENGGLGLEIAMKDPGAGGNVCIDDTKAPTAEFLAAAGNLSFPWGAFKTTASVVSPLG